MSVLVSDNEEQRTLLTETGGRLSKCSVCGQYTFTFPELRHKVNVVRQEGRRRLTASHIDLHITTCKGDKQ